MNLAGLHTRTRVVFNPALENDRLTLNGEETSGPAWSRVHEHLGRVRRLAGIEVFADVTSENNFPTGTGIASSASAFAALTLAAARAAGLELSERQLSRLARLGSGSACRSVPGGFVEWRAGEDDDTSYAYSIAPADHWDLVDNVAIISWAHKPTGSYQGHSLAGTSVLQNARTADAPRRLDICRQAVLQRDFEALTEVMELDSNLMHAVIMTSSPRLQYWQPPTLAVMQAVTEWRRSGVPACYTIDAGPNVHVICPEEYAEQVKNKLSQVPGVASVRTARPGGPVRCLAPSS
jgi:diphosphomevalonate decarboxylase